MILKCCKTTQQLCPRMTLHDLDIIDTRETESAALADGRSQVVVFCFGDASNIFCM